MKHLLLFAVSLLACNIAIGQTKSPNLDVFLNECILKGATDSAKSDLKKNTVHFYAIAFTFDKDGKIDTLYFSKKLNADTKRFYGLDNSLLKRIKSYNFQYREYSSQILLIPFYHYNSADDFVDYKKGFLNGVENLLPEYAADKPVIIRKPIINAHLPRTGRSTTYAQEKQVFAPQDQGPVIISQGPKKVNSDIRIPIIKGMGRAWDSQELQKVKKNTGHITSVGVSFNENGVVDTVYFSRALSPEISRILKPGALLTKNIRQSVKYSEEYKNKVVVFPIFIFDIESSTLMEFNPVTIKELTGMWPELSPNDQKKPLVLLDPFLNGFGRAVE